MVGLLRLQVALAGINLYIFGRVLGMRRPAALLSGVIFMFSGFLIVSVVFTMFMAAVVWLPLLLAIIELIIQRQETKGSTAFNPTLYVAAGVGVLTMVMLAGHPELIYYTLLVAGMFALFRLLVAWRGMGGSETGGKEEGKKGRKGERGEREDAQSALRTPHSALRIPNYCWRGGYW